MPSLMIEIGLAGQIRDQYDLIGFDPRGVGASTPVTCGMSADEVLGATLPFPAADGSITGNVAVARSMASRCWATSGRFLAYLNTANTARDMDMIRQAMGEQRISYFGVSYGTYLGAVYSTTFNQFTDRFVLDSAVDPSLVWYRMFATFGAGAAIRFPDAAAVLTDYPDLGLGTTPDAVTEGYLALASRLDARPVAVPGTELLLTGNQLRAIVFELLYNDESLPLIAEVLRVALGGTSEMGTTVISSLLRPGAPAGVPVDNSLALATAVLCGDAPWSRDVATYQRNVRAERAAYPLTAGMPANIRACAFWPTQPVEPTVAVTDRGQRNILQLQNRRDPATNWANGQGMRRALGQRAVFVGVDAGGHGVYSRGSCADGLVAAFLADGVLPERDQFCPGGATRSVRPGPATRAVTAVSGVPWL